MSALTQPRPTVWRAGDSVHDPLAAGAVIYAGALVALNATGFLVAGSTDAGLNARGVAQNSADNSAGADGDVSLEADKGVHQFANDAGDPVTRDKIGGNCYIVDDQTVAITSGGSTRSVAGKIFDVDANGVWVEFA